MKHETKMRIKMISVTILVLALFVTFLAVYGHYMRTKELVAEYEDGFSLLGTYYLLERPDDHSSLVDTLIFDHPENNEQPFHQERQLEFRVKGSYAKTEHPNIYRLSIDNALDGKYILVDEYGVNVIGEEGVLRYKKISDIPAFTGNIPKENIR